MGRKLFIAGLIVLIVAGAAFAARYGTNQTNLLTNTELAVWSGVPNVAGAAMTATNGPDNWGQSGATTTVTQTNAAAAPQGHVSSLYVSNESAVTNTPYHLFYPEAAASYTAARWYNQFEGETVCFGYMYSTLYTLGTGNVVRAYVDTSSDSSVSQFGTWMTPGSSGWTWHEDAFEIPSSVTGFRVGFQVSRRNVMPGSAEFSGTTLYVAAPRLVVDRYIGGDLIRATGNMTWLDIPFTQESFSNNGVATGVTTISLVEAAYDNTNRIPVGYARTYVVGLSATCTQPCYSQGFGFMPNAQTGVSFYTGVTGTVGGGQAVIPADVEGGVTLCFGAGHANATMRYIGVEAR